MISFMTVVKLLQVSTSGVFDPAQREVCRGVVVCPYPRFVLVRGYLFPLFSKYVPNKTLALTHSVPSSAG